MANILKLLRSIVSGNVPTLVTGQIAINEADGRLFFRNNAASAVESFFLRGNDFSTRAYKTISGGGTLSWTSGGITWTTRLTIVANGRGSETATSGYFDITVPANATVITGVGGAANITVTNGRILLPAGQVLYYILPLRSTFNSVDANFRVASTSTDIAIPPHWIPIAWYNADNALMYFCNNVTLKLNETWDTTKSTLGYINAANVSAVAQSTLWAMAMKR